MFLGIYNLQVCGNVNCLINDGNCSDIDLRTRGVRNCDFDKSLSRQASLFKNVLQYANLIFLLLKGLLLFIKDNVCLKPCVVCQTRIDQFKTYL